MLDKKFILENAALVQKNCTEAGAAGRASRGLYRVHQFTKIEMFFTLPEKSPSAGPSVIATGFRTAMVCQ